MTKNALATDGERPSDSTPWPSVHHAVVAVISLERRLLCDIEEQELSTFQQAIVFICQNSDALTKPRY